MAIPAVLLAGLWGYAATGLVSEQFQVRDDTSLAASVGGPAYSVLSQLQIERSLTATWQANRAETARVAMEKARTRTDAAIGEYRRKADSDLNGDELKGPAKSLTSELTKLTKNRSAIDRRTVSDATVFRYYTDAIAKSAAVIDAATRIGDGPLSRAGDATTSLVQVSEMLAREDALLSSAFASGELSAANRTQFGQYLAIQRHIRMAMLDADDLPGGQSAAYERLLADPRWKSLTAIEDAVGEGRGSEPPKQSDTWRASVDAIDTELSKVTGDSFAGLDKDGTDRADTLLLQAILGTLAAIAALVVTFVMLRRSGRSLTGRMERLQRQIEELGERRLPQILEQLDRGEHTLPDEQPAAAGPGADDLERLSASIERLGREFEGALVRQARGREGTEKVFANLTRRTQTLVHRLITLLDDLERKHEDSDLLQDIFKVDHLATRVRRHSENLVILGGSPSGRRGLRPLSVTDVVRGAVSETEQYRRVTVQSLPPGRQTSVAARAVADVTHLLAELIENGTTFSPPDTQVHISATKVAKGLALHVEDHGLGMPAEQYDRLNHLLANPPQPDMDALGKDPRLGLFVVAKLAERHGLKVSLRESDYGGTLAIVLIPSALLETHESSLPDELKAAAVLAGGPVSADKGPERVMADAVRAANGSAAPRPAGTVAPAAAGLDTLVPTPGGAAIGTPDVVTAHAAAPSFATQHGFPDYGGAGLLPSSSGGPAVDLAPTPVWSPPREVPVRHDGLLDAPSAPVAPSALSEPETPQPLEDPLVLPTRKRGASLAQQLREEAEPAQQGPQQDAEEVVGGFTPGRSAANMMAIQRETRRAREAQASRSTDLDGPAESSQHGTDEL